MAMGAATAGRERKLKISDDVSLIGCHDWEYMAQILGLAPIKESCIPCRASAYGGVVATVAWEGLPGVAVFG
jgi:hypothetical protein